MSRAEVSSSGPVPGPTGPRTPAREPRHGRASEGRERLVSLVRSLAAVLWEDDRVLRLDAFPAGLAVSEPCETGVVEVEETSRFERALPPEIRSYLRLNRFAGLTEDHRLFVATIDSEVAGITVLGQGVVRCHGRRRTVRLEDGEGYSYATYVAAHARDHGVGRVLIRHMLRRASFLGLRRVYAIIHPRNAASLRLYERSGFVVTGSWRFRRFVGLRKATWIPSGEERRDPRGDDPENLGSRREMGG